MRAALLALVVVAACRAPVPATARTEPDTLLPPALRTTAWPLAAANLDAMLESAEARLARVPTSGSTRRKLVALLATRATFGGVLEDAADLELLAAASAADVDALLARAEARLAVHRFRDAAADLDAATGQGGNPSEINGLRARLLEAAGRRMEAAALRAELPVTFERLVGEGILAREEERFDDAAAAFTRARTLLRDVAPYPVARLELEEALLLARQDRLEAARTLLGRVRSRVPRWVAPIQALADLARSPDDAIDVLRDALLEVDHPELADRLAALLSLTGRPDDAALVRDRAVARWRELVAIAPDAFSGHAAASLLDVKPLEAADLAKHDALRRDTRASWLLASDAAWTAGLRAEACEAWAKANATPSDEPLPARPSRSCGAVTMRVR